MKHSVSTVVKSIYTQWVGVDRHRFSSHNVGDTRRIHGLSVPNYHPRRLRIVASLNSWRFGVAEWDYSRCAAAVDVSSTDRIAVTDPTHCYGLARSIHGDDSGAVAAEILFRLSLRAKLSHSVAFIQYYGHRSRPSPWPELCTRVVGQKPFQGEQLLFLLSHFTRPFDECRCLPASRRSNQLAYPRPLDGSHTETEVGETGEFIEDSMGHLLPSLHEPRMY